MLPAKLRHCFFNHCDQLVVFPYSYVTNLCRNHAKAIANTFSITGQNCAYQSAACLGGGCGAALHQQEIQCLCKIECFMVLPGVQGSVWNKRVWDERKLHIVYKNKQSYRISNQSQGWANIFNSQIFSDENFETHDYLNFTCIQHIDYSVCLFLSSWDKVACDG